MVPNVRVPGLALASATNSPRLAAGQILPHHQDVRHDGDPGNRRKILHRVVRPALDQALIDDMGLAGAEDQRVAVGLGARHRVGADDARRAGAVFDHDRLPQFGCRLLRDQAGHDVDRPAGRVGHDDGDGAARKSLGASAAGGGQARQARRAWRGGTSIGSLSVHIRSRCEISTTRARRASSSTSASAAARLFGSRLASHSSSR